MRTRCGPLTAFADTFAVEMSASSVRDVIHRVAETVMPLPETRFGASASAVPEPPSSDRPTTTAAMNARTRGPANMDPLPVGRPRTVQRTRAFIKRAALRSRLPMLLRTTPDGLIASDDAAGRWASLGARDLLEFLAGGEEAERQARAALADSPPADPAGAGLP